MTSLHQGSPHVKAFGLKIRALISRESPLSPRPSELTRNQTGSTPSWALLSPPAWRGDQGPLFPTPVPGYTRDWKPQQSSQTLLFSAREQKGLRSPPPPHGRPVLQAPIRADTFSVGNEESLIVRVLHLLTTSTSAPKFYSRLCLRGCSGLSAMKLWG